MDSMGQEFRQGFTGWFFCSTPQWCQLRSLDDIRVAEGWSRGQGWHHSCAWCLGRDGSNTGLCWNFWPERLHVASLEWWPWSHQISPPAWEKCQKIFCHFSWTATTPESPLFLKEMLAPGILQFRKMDLSQTELPLPKVTCLALNLADAQNPILMFAVCANKSHLCSLHTNIQNQRNKFFSLKVYLGTLPAKIQVIL